MARPLKIVLWIAGGLLALVAVAAVALTLLFDPNDHKERIAAEVRKATGREFAIEGDIALTFFPWLGARVAGVTLGNAPGFGPEPFARVAEMTVGVRLMPLLLDREVRVGTVHIDGLALNLAVGPDGTTNWADLAKAGEKPSAPAPAEPREPGAPLALPVGGLEIENAAVSSTDRQAGTAYKVAPLSLRTGPVEPGQPVDVEIGFSVASESPALESEVEITFTALADLEAQVYQLKDLVLDSTSRGAAVPGGQQKASLRAQARYDGAQGAFALSDAVLQAAGLELKASVTGEKLATETPQLKGQVASNTFNPRKLAESFGIKLPPSADPTVLTQASFSAGIAGTPKNARLDNLSLKLDQTAATGWVAVRDFASQAIDFALKADAIDADRYLAPPDAAPAPTAEGKGSDRKGDFRKTEIPVAALEGLNASGTLELRSLKLKGLALTNIRVVLSALKGRPKTQEMTASLYGGRITQSARMVRNSPVRYDLKLGLDAIESAPLLKDLLGKSYLSGLGKFNLNVNSGGGTVGDVLRALSGAVSTGFSNGAVEGFNLAQTLENAKALARGETAQETGPKRTEFKDLSAAGKITNGVLATDTLNVKGSWYQLGGDGKINLVEQTLNYTLYPTVTAGDKLKELQGTRIPVAVTGSWFAPKVKVDLAGVVKGRVKQELQKQEEKVKDKAREKLGDFLRKQTEPAPQPKPKQPAATPPPPAGEGTQPAPAGQPEEPPPAEQQPAPSS